MMPSARRVRRLAAAAAVLLPALCAASGPLPALNADPARTSVSGLSSGAFMAVQYAVAYSASTIGAGVVAGGPYNCANLNPGGVLACMSGAPAGTLSWTSAQAFSALGQIDPASGISRLRIYLYSGTKDTVVSPAVVAAARDFFVSAGVPAQSLAYVDSIPSGHAFVAPSFGNACGSSDPPFIDQCPSQGQAYDQPKAILEQIYGPLAPPAPNLSARVRAFDQGEFTSWGSSMDSVGYVYVPAACASGARRCAVHVVFHGCQQGARAVGDDVYDDAGYNRWADTNGLVVLYPQAVASRFFPVNPLGCWDWWGYTGAAFMTRAGVQLSAVHAMVARLTAEQTTK